MPRETHAGEEDEAVVAVMVPGTSVPRETGSMTMPSTSATASCVGWSVVLEGLVLPGSNMSKQTIGRDSPRKVAASSLAPDPERRRDGYSHVAFRGIGSWGPRPLVRRQGRAPARHVA